MLAAIDDHVGHDLRQVGAAGYREDMILSLGAGNFHEGAGGQPSGLDENILGHRDLVVERQPLNDFKGSVIDLREAFAEFGLGPDFDRPVSKTQHVVEDLDLIFAEPLSLMRNRFVTCRRVLRRFSDEPLLTASSSSAMRE